MIIFSALVGALIAFTRYSGGVRGFVTDHDPGRIERLAEPAPSYVLGIVACGVDHVSYQWRRLPSDFRPYEHCSGKTGVLLIQRRLRVHSAAPQRLGVYIVTQLGLVWKVCGVLVIHLIISTPLRPYSLPSLWLGRDEILSDGSC